MKTNPTFLITSLVACLGCLPLFTHASESTENRYPVAPLPETRQIADGPFEANWESLINQYACPDWFRDAKFGIWAHWSAQCVPEEGDWYARSMYIQGHDNYDAHVRKYGHPSEFGFMEIDNLWTAENWDPEALMELFVEAGARYFVALANHEDNFDTYDSKYHAWNATNVGPKRDIIGTWQAVARKHDLKFGVSNHSSHAWHWFQTAYGYDGEGPRAGDRYDAYHLTPQDGKGLWWEGLDPADLYGKPSIVVPDGYTDAKTIHRWHDTNNLPWTELQPPGDPEFVSKWFHRLQDLMDSYEPDYVYLDNGEIPFGQVGLDIVTHFYNSNTSASAEKPDVVLTAKGLSGAHRPAVVQAWERAAPNQIQAMPFQAETCIGQWHYKRDIEYKSPRHVLQILVDIVSKNGTLLLSIPQRGDGTIDHREVAILKQIADWMAINSEGIYETRPWHVFGEGPTEVPGGRAGDQPLPYTHEDVRFTTKDGVLYCFTMLAAEKALELTSLGLEAPHGSRIDSVSLLGDDKAVSWSQNDNALRIEPPATLPNRHLSTFRITFQ